MKSESTKTEALGLDPKAARQQARSLLQEGYYVSASGRNSAKVLHGLRVLHGAGYRLPHGTLALAMRCPSR